MISNVRSLIGAVVLMLTAALAARAGDESPPPASQVAPIGQFVKQTPIVNSRLKRGVGLFDEQKAEISRLSAIMAAIAQAASADTHEVRDPADLPRWHELCGRCRDAAGELNAAAHAADATAASSAFLKVESCCKDCHAKFRKSNE